MLKGGNGDPATMTLVPHDAGLKGTLDDEDGDGTYTFTAEIVAGEKYNIGGVEYEIAADGKLTEEQRKAIADALNAANSIGADTKLALDTDDVSEAGVVSFAPKTASVAPALSFSLHVGADADMTNKITVEIGGMDSKSLGIKGITVADNTGANATYAIDAIADAVAKVSAQRSSLGAIQNRLEHTIANLDNVVENTTAAESRIRDTDMAEEMVEFSKNNILAQAGQSMLAQANTSTQGVLSLLQ